MPQNWRSLGAVGVRRAGRVLGGRTQVAVVRRVSVAVLARSPSGLDTVEFDVDSTGLHPLLDALGHRDGRLRMLVLVDLPVQENDFLAGLRWPRLCAVRRPCPQDQDCLRSLPR